MRFIFARSALVELIMQFYIVTLYIYIIVINSSLPWLSMLCCSKPATRPIKCLMFLGCAHLCSKAGTRKTLHGTIVANDFYRVDAGATCSRVHDRCIQQNEWDLEGGVGFVYTPLNRKAFACVCFRKRWIVMCTCIAEPLRGFRRRHAPDQSLFFM